MVTGQRERVRQGGGNREEKVREGLGNIQIRDGVLMGKYRYEREI
jgi:hypothetical protein